MQKNWPYYEKINERTVCNKKAHTKPIPGEYPR